MFKENLLLWNAILAATLKPRWVQAEQQVRGFFHRAAGTSKFGYLVQATGVALLDYGLYLIYHPAAWILGGVLVLLLGEKL